MKYSIDEKKKIATVYRTHEDQNSREKQQELDSFIADCKSKKIFVCVFDSGDGDLLENTKSLLMYNHNNSVTPDSVRR